VRTDDTGNDKTFSGLMNDFLIMEALWVIKAQ
jgi:hypothetical protein